MLLSVPSDVLLLVALLPQLSFSKPKKENRQAQEENHITNPKLGSIKLK
jgi:hypothetical protein